MKRSKYIDQTLLKADATKEEIEKLCHEAKEYDFASVCINPYWVSLCAEILKDSDVKVCTVIGFPLGANTTATKVFETQDAIKNGADEIDMVMNIGCFKSEEYDVVLNDIKAVKQAAQDKIVKVIIETCLLNNNQIIKACQIVKDAKADFVKTSTGFSSGGADVENIALMKNVIGNDVLIKASGGIRTTQDFDALVDAGAVRIGTSNGIGLL